MLLLFKMYVVVESCPARGPEAQSLTRLREEADGVWQLALLQLKLALLDDLEQVAVREHGELGGHTLPLTQEPPLQLHIRLRHQLTHDRLALDLRHRHSDKTQAPADP